MIQIQTCIGEKLIQTNKNVKQKNNIPFKNKQIFSMYTK